MDRKNLGIIASALVLIILMLWLTQGDDEGAQAAAAAKGTISAPGSRTVSAAPSTTPSQNPNSFASTQQNDRNAAYVTQANQPKSSATATNSKLKASPLEPRAEPYALMANSGRVNVRFSVRLIGDADPSSTVYLRQSGSESGIAMNDQGTGGDVIAGDRIHGVTVPINTSALKPDICLSYEAVLGEIVSSPLLLCVSNLPVRTAASNTDKPVVFSDGSKAVADEILITAQPGTKIAAMQAIATSINATIVGSIPPLNLYQLKLPAPASEAQLNALVAQLNARPEVKAASVNAIGQPAALPNDPEYVNQHGLQLVRAQDVWDIGASGSGVVVAVLDTGLDRTHPDFGTVGNCQLAENDCGGAITDTLGHGTEVAGVIAAKTNNGVGVAGIAPGSKVHSIQVSTTWGMTAAQMTQSFTNAASYGLASVINASFGGQWPPISAGFGSMAPLCDAVNAAVVNSGVPVSIVVAAAGNNNNTNVVGSYTEDYYPARCNDSTNAMHAGLTRKDLFITVAATASKVEPTCGSVAVDQRCTFSNYGAWVDMAAPGADVRLVALGGGYTSAWGTSFSTPMVAGAAAILKSCGVPLDQIESTLRNSANVTVSFPNGNSSPRLDIYRALLSRNRAPSSLSISNNGLNDFTDTSAGIEVGTLTTADADTCDKHTYSIIGGADAAMFSISGAASDRLILTAGMLNYASKPSYAVTLRVTDYFGVSPATDLPVTVNVIPANNAPTIAAQSFTVNENSASGTNVGTVVASDPDSGNTLSYSITSGNTSNAFSIANTGVLSVSNTASGSTYSLVVTVTDNFGASASATVTVNINNAPTISHQTFSINEGSSNGAPVGNVAASDPNGNTVSYSILAGNINNAFLLDATTGDLSVNNSAALVFASTPSFNLTVRVSDGGGLTASANVIVNLSQVVTPTPPPAAPPTSGGGGGCSVMPANAASDSSLPLVVLVVLGYWVLRRKIHLHAQA